MAGARYSGRGRKREDGYTSLTIAVPDQGVEQEHGDPQGDDEGDGEAVQTPLPPVTGSLRHCALHLRRRRPPQKGLPRPLHSFPAPPGFPHIRTRKPHPPARQGHAESGRPPVGAVGNQKQRGVRRKATRAKGRGCADAAAWRGAGDRGF
jgi:hypothetical protein